MEKISAIRGFVAMLIAFLWLLPSVGNADPHKLTCGKEKTIGEALHELKPGDTLLVSGVCNENLVIPEEVHRITLDGQGTAVIDGPDATRATIEVRGTGITIKRFTISRGRDGIRTFEGGTAIIDSNTIQNTANNGINVSRHSSAHIINNMVRNNPGGITVANHSQARIGFSEVHEARIPDPNTIQNNDDGITVSRSSHVDIAFNTISNNASRGITVSLGAVARMGGLSDTGPSGNTISGNGSDGIRVSDSSQAQIAGNTISNNTGRGISVTASSSGSIFADIGPTPNTIQGNGSDGIRVNRASQASISGNTINSNGGDGIRVEENSGVNLDAANTTAVNNGGRGLRCLIGAYARGSLGTLTGNSGQTSFDATCINATSP